MLGALCAMGPLRPRRCFFTGTVPSSAVLHVCVSMRGYRGGGFGLSGRPTASVAEGLRSRSSGAFRRSIGHGDGGHASGAGGRIAHTTVMSSSTGLTWVDVEGTRGMWEGDDAPAEGSPRAEGDGPTHNRLSDAEFVMAMRRTLRSYDVPEALLSEISRVVLLPLTVVAQHQEDPAVGRQSSPSSSSKKDVCFVCRYAKIERYSGAHVTTLERARREMGDGAERRGSASNHVMPPGNGPMGPLSGHPAQQGAGRAPHATPAATFRPAAALGAAMLRGGAAVRSMVMGCAALPAAFVSTARDIITPRGTLLQQAKASRLAQQHQGQRGLSPLPIGASLSSRRVAAGDSGRGGNTLNGGDGVVFETIQQLSSRLTVFILPRQNMVVTVHRYPIRSIRTLRLDWHKKMRKVTLDGLLRKLVIDCAQSYLDMERVRASEVDKLEERLFETAPATASHWTRIRMALFTKPSDTFRASLETLYAFSREASAYCRILQPLMRAYEEARVATQGNTRNIDLVEHRIAAAISMCEGLREQTQSLLSLQFSVGAGQLEELFRLLTVFSTIFIPLEFVASLGGADVPFVTVLLDNNDISLYVLVGSFGLVFAITMLWLRRMVF